MSQQHHSINILCVIPYFIIVSGMDTHTYVVCDGKGVFKILSMHRMI